MGQEFELKFTAGDAQQEAIFAAFGPWQKYEMETTYYDTPDRSLSARHVTLRRRMENENSICTVKTPRPDGARGEWECQCEDIRTALSQLHSLGAPEFVATLAAETLIPVCGARFTRHSCPIELDDTVVELALDKGALLGGGREIPLCEVEAELKEGDRDAVIRFAATLAAQYGLQPERRSKFSRATDLAEGETR